MAEENYEKDLHQSPKQSTPGELDAAGKSLSEALRISFVILKIIMFVLVVFFLLSGFETIEPDQQAIVLRFGRISGSGEGRLLGPGLHWVFPYPIDEIVKIPVGKKSSLSINSFWYYQKPSDMLPEGPKPRDRVEPTLRPEIDGYSITRNEKQEQSSGSDYNIVHTRWQLIYQIDDPIRLFKNVYVDTQDLQPGQSYADIIGEKIAPLLRYLVEDSIVSAMVNYTIDEAISSKDRIPRHVEKLLQEKLNKIESGIKAVSVQLTDVIWPRQVNAAFLASIKASQAKQRAINEAETYAEKTLIEASGQSQEKIFRARAYRTKVVETAKADAEYLQEILPKYYEHPQLVVQRIYQDAMESVLDNVDEKIIVQPTEGTRGKEIRIILNRDPAIKPKSRE